MSFLSLCSRGARVASSLAIRQRLLAPVRSSLHLWARPTGIRPSTLFTRTFSTNTTPTPPPSQTPPSIQPSSPKKEETTYELFNIFKTSAPPAIPPATPAETASVPPSPASEQPIPPANLSDSEILFKLRQILNAHGNSGGVPPEIPPLLREITATLNKFRGGGGGAPGGEPLQVAIKTSWDRRLISLLGLVLSFTLVYYLLGRSGNGIFSELNPSYSPADDVDVRFADVKGCDEAKEELVDLVDYLRNPGKYAAYDVKMPKGVLFVGPPGTGKTLLARAMAGEADVPFYYVTGSEFEEVFVGLGARRIRSLFKEAKNNAPCIIFVDEIDAVGGKRKHHFGSERQTLNQLLTELDGFEPNEGVIVIAATNTPNVLDPALIRPGRFDRKVKLSLPDRETRKDIIELYLKNRAGPDVDTDILSRATPRFSGAELANMVNWAAIETAKAGLEKITMSALENAKENVIMGKERRGVKMTEKAIRLTAYHESGHAITALLTEGASPIHKATLVPRGDALGMVSFTESDEHMITRQELMARMDVAMGGRAAEELMFGSKYVTTGASSDFQGAYNVASHMVRNCGMSDLVGRVNVGSPEEGNPQVSDELRNIIDREIKALTDASYARTMELLTKNKEKLERLAEALLEYETLNLAEIKLVIEGKPLVNKKNKTEARKDRDAIKKALESTRTSRPVVPTSTVPTPGQQGPKRPALPTTPGATAK